MAATAAGIVVAEPVHEVPHWLKTLPVAPEFHPTLAEFEDPISYILKIEKEASKYGICKIVPPVALPSKKTTVTHLNRSLVERSKAQSLNSKPLPTFSTRYQQIGFDPRRGRPVQKPVWQSGEWYTLQQFEAKAKLFERVHLKRSGKKGYSALEIETLFWRASVDKPFTVEYANDMPGSAFAPVKSPKSLREVGEGATVAETAWNMRGVARGKGSLLRFMKEEIPGVTSPMVYIAMLFSWFAWHVEDHDLHSLNYMHMGAAKTWYGVPKDAALAFQDVVRVEGYGGDFNPLVTFATLGEKTTVMSPEVLIGAGIPCCRLVQNVGEFVVTFPGAYHSGFSHGFNCAEASNIATPEWLRFAKEAAVRRASINYPPMVSHFQLLYALAQALCSRTSTSTNNEPRSSRLKDRKKGEGEGMVKEFFVQSVIQNNDLLHVLLSHGSSCVLLPRNSSEISLYLSRRIGTQKTAKRMMSLGLCSNDEAAKVSEVLLSDENALERNVRFRHLNGIDAVNKTNSPTFTRDSVSSLSIKPNYHGNVDLANSASADTDMKNISASQDIGLLEKGLFPCVQCGILSFACAAIIEPREAATQYFMSADSSIFNNWKAGSGVLKAEFAGATKNENNFEPNDTSEGEFENSVQDCLYEVPVRSGDYEVQVSNQRVDEVSPRGTQKVISSLDLLASVYGNSSDSDEELVEPEMVMDDDNMRSEKQSENDDSGLHSPSPDHHYGASGNVSFPQSPDHGNEVSVQVPQCASYSRRKRKWTRYGVESQSQQTSDCSLESDADILAPMKFKCMEDPCTDKGFSPGRLASASAEINETDLYTNQIESVPVTSSVYPRAKFSHAVLGETAKYTHNDISLQNTDMSLMQISKAESSRMHIFCLEHAVEVEKQLRSIGGANILLLCHPEYPKAEAEAKSMAPDLGIDHLWKDIPLKEATEEDQERIALALEDANADPSNGDWAVKLGINLYYSVHLSKSPLYTKQMPYNSVIYKVFGFSSPTNYPMEVKVSGKVPGKQKKIFVAGKWCGKVWMSNQVHPYLAQKESEEDPLTYNSRAPSCLKPSLKPEKKVGPSRRIKEPVTSEERFSPVATTTTDRNCGQKRKSGEVANKKKATAKLESPTQTTEDSSESDSSSLSSGRSLGNGQPTRRRPLRQYSSLKNIRQFDSKSKVKVESQPTVAKNFKHKKRNIEKEPAMRSESPELESPTQSAEDSSESDSPPLSTGRFLSNEQNKRIRSLLSPCTVKTTSQNDSHLKFGSEDGPSTRLRKRPAKLLEEEVKPEPKQTRTIKAKKAVPTANEIKNEEAEYHCDLDGCTMSFSSKHEMVLHKRNVCPVKGCGKKFFSHKYLVQHRRVHIDDRPLKCPWKGCKMTFKWAWARTEHIRVHTGDRPYVCREKGCGQTFRFVSDFSRHKRKTGHSVKAKG